MSLLSKLLMMLPMPRMKGIADTEIHSIVETVRYQYDTMKYYVVGVDNDEEECDQRYYYDAAQQNYCDSGTRQIIGAAPPDYDDDAMMAAS